ncbi:LysR family transcriptional regulator [Paracoccus aestuariivivens]|uniref:LysR family transcriptional regulator n=1 Tax=Paracoccus aestuariivivens TaxID=1820333 RepID=A0A6L6J6Z9_9RHOB|nr:LysR family transcriptional regulator [Paracoccus aestuariivivens]MTH77852.1 LysR family transcriptional regulator [Paracoccus aestuariivivens]
MKTVDPLYGIAAFLAVAEQESFTLAAEGLGLSRATVSAQVSDLERRLGVRLLHRSTRIVRLTPAGQVYREQLSDLGQRVDLAERAAKAEHTAPEGRLRLTAPPDFCHRFLVPWISQFLALHPGMRIELDLSNDERNLIEGRFDLAIRGTIAVGPNLITRALGGSALLTCASAGYLARRGRPLTPNDLVGHDLLHFTPLRRGRVWTMTQGPELVAVPILPRLELNDGTALMVAALNDGGICQLPAFVVGDALRSGRLEGVLTDWRAGVVPLHAVYPDNRLIALRVKAFVNFLARKSKSEPDLSCPT